MGINAICVFCGSSTGLNPAYADAARKLGEVLATAGTRLIYGGGSVGLMGILADEMLERGGEVTGVIPQSLWDHEVGHHFLTELHITTNMHERKAKMADLSDAFIALPGGVGTIEELVEIWTWAQLGIHQKPCGLINVAGYFDPFRAFIDKMVEHGFLKPEHREMLIVAENPEELLSKFAAYKPPSVPKWMSLKAT